MKQWSRNDTTAQKFYLWKCSDSDLLNATWNVDLTQKMEWTNYSLDDDYINDTNYHSESNFTACPTPGKTYLLRKEYLDNDHVFETIRSKSLAKSSMSKFTDLAISNSSDFVASRLLTKIGFENIPGLSSAMSIIEILSTANSDADWNAFATTAQNGKGIIKYTYIKIEDKPIWGVIPGSAAYGWIHHIDDVKTYKYEVWDGEGEFTTVPGYTGTWTFRFK